MPELTITQPGTHNCTNCGRELSDGDFCPGCGQRIDPAPAVPRPHRAPRKRIAVIAAGGAIGLAALATAAVIALNGGSSGPSTTTVYHQKLTAALSPVLSADRTLSSSLKSLHGTDTRAATDAVSQAQTAVTAARGAIAILTVPADSSQLSQQAQQALAQESGLLQAVSATLTSPSQGNVAQPQTLATDTQSALIALGAVAPGGAQNISGIDALSSWASGRIAAAAHDAQQAQQRAIQQAARQAAQQTASTSSSSGTSTASDASSGATSGSSVGDTRDCGGGLHAGPNTSCLFAENVQSAWLNAPGVTNTLQVYSPVTGITYTMSCAPAGAGVTCSGANNASVSW